jgi:hypothetical protein
MPLHELKTAHCILLKGYLYFAMTNREVLRETVSRSHQRLNTYVRIWFSGTAMLRLPVIIFMVEGRSTTWGLYNVQALNPSPSTRQRLRIVEHDNGQPPAIRHATYLDRKALVFQAADH